MGGEGRGKAIRPPPRAHARTPVRSLLPLTSVGYRTAASKCLEDAQRCSPARCSLFAVLWASFFLCRSLFIFCWLYVFDCSLFTVYCLLFVVRCPILIIRYTLYLFSVLWSLLIVDFIVIHFSLFNEFIVQFTHCSLFVNHFSLFFVCCLLFTVRCLQFLMHGNEHQSQRENNEDYLRRRTMQPHTRV